ncbi:MAG: NADH:flavin oxidoreductase/NADH oxidase [Deltaproteobacteria bacterium]|nr:MAG: NADH:flavin oxidoreductase/NADH oxidase [Deltaproteobacteria bacterium]
MAKLFSPFRLKGIEFKNRIFVSPMCQYSSEEGKPTDWHLVHLGSRAVGGASMVMVEATAVSPEGRISPWDSGIWGDIHAQEFKRISAFVEGQGAVPGIQLAHAGRKASTDVPWRDEKPLTPSEGGWQPLAPSPIPFEKKYSMPREMTAADMEEVTSRFAAATRRSLGAGFKVVEIHMAHGYLVHEFLSPLTNKRKDEYGGSLQNRMRFPLWVARAVRENWPSDLPLFVRISCTDWVDGGWDLAQSIEFSHRLKEIGVDLIDCSSGGTVPYAKIPAGPGYQTPFAAEIRSKVGIATATVGLIMQPLQAEHVLVTGQADAVMIARELLRDPYWPLHAAQMLHVDLEWPPQYRRAKPR